MSLLCNIVITKREKISSNSYRSLGIRDIIIFTKDSVEERGSNLNSIFQTEIY